MKSIGYLFVFLIAFVSKTPIFNVTDQNALYFFIHRSRGMLSNNASGKTPLLNRVYSETSSPIALQSESPHSSHDSNEINPARKRFKNRVSSVNRMQDLNLDFLKHETSEHQQDVLEKTRERSNEAKAYSDLCYDDTPHPDIKAMSVLSLYQNEHDLDTEMDTDR